MRTPIYLAITALGIFIYLGLAVHVITRSPRRRISWVFGAFCLGMVAYYVTSLYLFPDPEPPQTTPLILRVQWGVMSFAPALILHLYSFYFPRNWTQHQSWMIRPAYFLSVGFSLSALFTDQFIVGPLYRRPPNNIGPVPGPLMFVFVVFWFLTLILASIGLMLGFRESVSRFHRRQIIYLLIPFGLITAASIFNWLLLLTMDRGRTPSVIGDTILLVAALFFARAVIQYGSLVGRPLAWRDLIYSLTGIFFTLILFYLALRFDQHISKLTPFPHPLLTSMLVVIFVTSFPFVYRQLPAYLDKIIPTMTEVPESYSSYFVERLVEGLNPENLERELLNNLCSEVQVRGGFLAIGQKSDNFKTYKVYVVEGDMQIEEGDEISPPPPNGKEPQLVIALTAGEHTASDWQEIALFCRLTVLKDVKGFLALGEKKGGSHFTPRDISICAAFAAQLELAAQMQLIYTRRNQHLEEAYLQDKALRQLEEQVSDPTLYAWRDIDQKYLPLALHVLGPLEVKVYGQTIAESAWGTERAKAVLAYLLWKGKTGATREEICTIIWPDYPEARATNVFHVTMNRLRQALEPSLQKARESKYVIHERNKYWFNLDAPLWLDVTVFRSLASSENVADLRTAVALYRGSYLDDAGWGLPPDVEIERRALEHLYERVLRRLLQFVDGQESEIYLQKLLLVNPMDEDIWRALIDMYLAQGRSDLARYQVDRWGRELQKLGYEASPDVRAYWKKVMSAS